MQHGLYLFTCEISSVNSSKYLNIQDLLQSEYTPLWGNRSAGKGSPRGGVLSRVLAVWIVIGSCRLWTRMGNALSASGSGTSTVKPRHESCGSTATVDGRNFASKTIETMLH